MPLTIAEVIEKAGKEEMAYIYDAPVHYVVFTRPDNTWNLDRINKYLGILDQIEATEGPGVMVTIGTGSRHFSTGFDLPYWTQDVKNMKDSILRFSEVMARLLEFPMPTLAVFNGTAYAGGYIWGLCHDSRIMHESLGTICLSELKIGLPLPMPYMLVCKAKLTPIVCSKVCYGIVVAKQEALQDGLIDDTYTPETLQAKITAFAKRFAPMGAAREAIMTNKQNQYESTINGCRSFTFTPILAAALKQNHAMVKQYVAMMAKRAQTQKAAAPKL